jgi:hypothetical protein
MTPTQKAEYWCNVGLDQDGFKVQYFSSLKGIHEVHIHDIEDTMSL